MEPVARPQFGVAARHSTPGPTHELHRDPTAPDDITAPATITVLQQHGELQTHSVQAHDPAPLLLLEVVPLELPLLEVAPELDLPPLLLPELPLPELVAPELPLDAV